MRCQNGASMQIETLGQVCLLPDLEMPWVSEGDRVRRCRIRFLQGTPRDTWQKLELTGFDCGFGLSDHGLAEVIRAAKVRSCCVHLLAHRQTPPIDEDVGALMVVGI